MPLQILFVDDSITMQRAMQIAFSREDAEVICVSDGDAALTQVRQARPDVILVDVTLGRGDGYTVCAELKELPDLAQVPVMLLASKQNPIDESRVAACGAAGHGIKPFDAQTLVDRVRALVNLPPSAAAVPTRTPRPAAPAAPAQTPALQGVPQQPAPVAAAPATPAPPPRPATPPPSAPPQTPASFATPVATPQPVASSVPAQSAPRTVPQTPPTMTPPPQRPAASQPAASAPQTSGGWSTTQGPAAPPQKAPASPARPPVVSGAPPMAFRGPPAAAPRQGSAAASRGRAAPVGNVAQTASRVAAQGVGQALAREGLPVDQAALMTLAREIIERVAWEVVPELAESMIREQLARQAKTPGQ